jgi:hypothetical protein
VTNRRDFLVGLSAGAGALAAIWADSLRFAWAHRARVTLTRLTHNLRTDRWEIIHALHYHDAATALRRLEPGAGLAPTTAQGQARLMLEIERQILWQSKNGALSPAAVGAELAGDSVMLYQECPPASPGTRISVQSRFLHREFSDQVNHVHIELKDPPRLLRLDANTPSAEFTV